MLAGDPLPRWPTKARPVLRPRCRQCGTHRPAGKDHEKQQAHPGSHPFSESQCHDRESSDAGALVDRRVERFFRTSLTQREKAGEPWGSPPATAGALSRFGEMNYFSSRKYWLPDAFTAMVPAAAMGFGLPATVVHTGAGDSPSDVDDLRV